MKKQGIKKKGRKGGIRKGAKQALRHSQGLFPATIPSDFCWRSEPSYLPLYKLCITVELNEGMFTLVFEYILSNVTM